MVLRTPDERFANLEDWPYEPRYTEVDGGAHGPLRIAHAEAGPADGPVVLCMHGEPSWSYLYRKMIPVFAAAGCRVLAPTSSASAARTSWKLKRTTPTPPTWAG
jgi:haloalkane dehalogenase